MIFHFLGRVVRRAWPLLLVLWGVLWFVTWRQAPPWDQVAQDREFAFLPDAAPSRRAAEVFARAFPEEISASNIALILFRSDNEPGHLERDQKFIEEVLRPALLKIAEAEGGLAGDRASVPEDEPLFDGDGGKAAKPARRSIIANILTPNGLGYGPLLVSEDGRALLVLLELTTEFLSNDNWATIARWRS